MMNLSHFLVYSHVTFVNTNVHVAVYTKLWKSTYDSTLTLVYWCQVDTHIQYTQSVTGRKRGDGLQRIVTVHRVVITRHELSQTVSTITPEVMSRKGIAEINRQMKCVNIPRS